MMGEWKSRKDSEGHQEPASTLAGTSAAEERDVPAEVVLQADLSVILRLGTWKEGGGRARSQRGFTVRVGVELQAEAGGGGSVSDCAVQGGSAKQGQRCARA